MRGKQSQSSQAHFYILRFEIRYWIFKKAPLHLTGEGTHPKNRFENFIPYLKIVCGRNENT